jgi:rod shape-determining protein MreD
MSTLPAYILVWITILVGLGLNGLPITEALQLLWPDWVLLVLAYWALAVPERFSVGVAFIAGLFQDVLTGTLLGMHALAYVVAVYLLVENHLRIRLLHLWGQAGALLLLALFATVIQLWVEGPASQSHLAWWSLLSALTTALLWPPVFLALRRYRQRFEIA